MEFFNFGKKKEQDKAQKTTTGTNNTTNNTANNEALSNLLNYAGAATNMLMGVFITDQGIDIRNSLIFASGLAGHACHRAVKANNMPQNIIELKNGKKYYFGDSVNKYLLQNDCSVLRFVNGIHEIPNEKIMDMVNHCTMNIGKENVRLWGNQDPAEVYKQVKTCWEGIYNNMTEKACKAPDEWPVFFGIVLHNLIKKAMAVGASADEVAQYSMECAMYISKMDDDSI